MELFGEKILPLGHPLLERSGGDKHTKGAKSRWSLKVRDRGRGHLLPEEEMDWRTRSGRLQVFSSPLLGCGTGNVMEDLSQAWQRSNRDGKVKGGL